LVDVFVDVVVDAVVDVRRSLRKLCRMGLPVVFVSFDNNMGGMRDTYTALLTRGNCCEFRWVDAWTEVRRICEAKDFDARTGLAHVHC
jgi:hypothetical protein